MTRHVLLVCPDSDNASLVKHTGLLALSLKQRGLTVSLWSYGNHTPPFHELAINHHHDYPPRRITSWLHVPWARQVTAKFKTFLMAQTNIDIIHFTSLPPYCRDMLTLCHQHNCPATVDVWRDEQLIAVQKKRLFSKKPAWILDQFHKIIVPSTALLAAAATHHLHNLTLIPTGVDLDRFKPVLSKRPIRRRLGLPESGALVICLADIHPDNNQLELLKLCQPLSDMCHLLLMGQTRDPLYLERIKTAAERNGDLPYITVKPPADNPEDYLKAADVFVLLGGIEAREQNILEAQACGVPVVLAPAANALNLTNGNKTGVVLSENNPQTYDIANKLMNDPNFRQGRSIHTRPFIKKNHNIKDTMDAYATLFNHAE